MTELPYHPKMERISLSASPPPFSRSGPVTHEQETRHLMEMYEGNAAPIMAALSSQFDTLAGRSQTLLSLVGLIVSVTSIGGANIARSGKTAAVLLLAGLVSVIFSGSLAIVGILKVKWTTQMAPAPLEEAVCIVLTRRDAKTRIYFGSLTLLVVGLILYVAALGIMLSASVPR
jgi:hypothetical protein